MISQNEFFEAMTLQALFMKKGLAQRIQEIFPSGDDPKLVVSGLVFRPADDDDAEEEDLRDESQGLKDLFVFEAHYYAGGHPFVGNISERLLLEFEGCGYEGAKQRFYEKVMSERTGGVPEELDEDSALNSLG